MFKKNLLGTTNYFAHQTYLKSLCFEVYFCMRVSYDDSCSQTTFRNVCFYSPSASRNFLHAHFSTEPQCVCVPVCEGSVFACTHIHTFVPRTLLRSISVCRHRPMMGVVKYGMALWYLTPWCFGVILGPVLLTKRIW